MMIITIPIWTALGNYAMAFGIGMNQMKLPKMQPIYVMVIHFHLMHYQKMEHGLTTLFLLIMEVLHCHGM